MLKVPLNVNNIIYSNRSNHLTIRWHHAFVFNISAIGCMCTEAMKPVKGYTFFFVSDIYIEIHYLDLVDSLSRLRNSLLRLGRSLSRYINPFFQFGRSLSRYFYLYQDRPFHEQQDIICYVFSNEHGRLYNFTLRHKFK